MKLSKDNEWRTSAWELTTSKNVKESQAYEWVKTGYWSLKEFKRWLEDRLT